MQCASFNSAACTAGIILFVMWLLSLSLVEKLTPLCNTANCFSGCSQEIEKDALDLNVVWEILDGTFHF